MKITGATDTVFPDGERLPLMAGHRLKAADGSLIIGDNYVDESCEMYIVSGHRNSVGAGCHNISILNSSGCVVNAGLSHVVIMNSSGVTVTESGETYNNGVLTSQESSTGTPSTILRWHGLVSQSGSNAPNVIRVLNQNNSDFLGNLTSTEYTSTGEFKLKKTGAFTSQKTSVISGRVQGASGANDEIRAWWGDANSINLMSFTRTLTGSGFTLANDLISLMEILIEVEQ